jgi:hypothetical protein
MNREYYEEIFGWNYQKLLAFVGADSSRAGSMLTFTRDDHRSTIEYSNKVVYSFTHVVREREPFYNHMSFAAECRCPRTDPGQNASIRDFVNTCETLSVTAFPIFWETEQATGYGVSDRSKGLRNGLPRYLTQFGGIFGRGGGAAPDFSGPDFFLMLLLSLTVPVPNAADNENTSSTEAPSHTRKTLLKASEVMNLLAFCREWLEGDLVLKGGKFPPPSGFELRGLLANYCDFAEQLKRRNPGLMEELNRVELLSGQMASMEV